MWMILSQENLMGKKCKQKQGPQACPIVERRSTNLAPTVCVCVCARDCVGVLGIDWSHWFVTHTRTYEIAPYSANASWYYFISKATLPWMLPSRLRYSPGPTHCARSGRCCLRVLPMHTGHIHTHSTTTPAHQLVTWNSFISCLPVLPHLGQEFCDEHQRRLNHSATSKTWKEGCG